MHVAFGHGHTATIPAGQGYPSRSVIYNFYSLPTFFMVSSLVLHGISVYKTHYRCPVYVHTIMTFIRYGNPSYNNKGIKRLPDLYNTKVWDWNFQDGIFIVKRMTVFANSTNDMQNLSYLCKMCIASFSVLHFIYLLMVKVNGEGITDLSFLQNIHKIFYICRMFLTVINFCFREALGIYATVGQVLSPLGVVMSTT